jgi:nucleoside-diphosphate-sugar epimerase
VKVLVTGAGGFIGSHLAERLVREGHEVRVLDNFSTGRRENLQHLAGHVEVLEGDIQSYERAHVAIRGCELIFHQAALPSVPRSVQDPLTSNGCNVVGTLNVLLAARDEDVRRVVFASSSSVYGATPDLPKHEGLPTMPFSPYAVAKLAGEGYCRSFHEVYGLSTVALRYFNVFGPRQDPTSQYSAVVPKFITSLLAGQPPTIHGDGEQTRDFTYIDNVVEANILAGAADGVEGRHLNVACGDRFSLNDLVQQLGEIIGTDVTPAYAAGRVGDVRDSQADISLARELLGYAPRVSFREGLELTVDHFRSR